MIYGTFGELGQRRICWHCFWQAFCALFFFLHVVLLLLLVDCRSHRNLGVADGMFCIVRARPASTLRVFVAKCCWQTGQRGEKVWHRVAASCCWKAWKMLFVVRENLKEGDVWGGLPSFSFAANLRVRKHPSWKRRNVHSSFYRCIQPSSLPQALFLLHWLHDSLIARFPLPRPIERKCVRECAALGSWARYKSPMPDTKRGRVNVWTCRCHRLQNFMQDQH